MVRCYRTSNVFKCVSSNQNRANICEIYGIVTSRVRHIAFFLISGCILSARIYFYCQLLLTIRPPFPISAHVAYSHGLAHCDYKFKQSPLI